MGNTNRWHSTLAWPATWVIAAGALMPWAIAPSARAQSRFNDIQGHWAQTCIEQLANRQIITGYQDGSFRPASPVTRVEFAVLISKAFPNTVPVREPTTFADIPTDYWAAGAIQSGYRANFLSGYSGGIFNPNQKIKRVQALISLASGLRYSPSPKATELLNSAFEDAADIPSYAQNGIAAATEKGIVVNYPNVTQLKPNDSLTRAEVASFVCQALTNGQTALVPAQYIAQLSPSSRPSPVTQTASNTKIQTVEAGNVRAEFSYEPQDPNSTGTGSNLRLKLVRAGQTLLDKPVLLSARGLADSPDGSDERVSEGRLLGLEVRDIDGDREPEVITDLFSTKSGNNCCAYSFIYRYDPGDNRYSHIEQSWANVGYEVKDVESDGIPEFDSLDSRFSAALDIPSADTRLPKRIWHYRQGRMVDVTRQYPQLVYEHSIKLWQEYQERQTLNQEVKGVLAAYLANKFLLDQSVEGWQILQQVYQGSDRDEYFAQLGKLLDELGYDSRKDGSGR